jgi:hypothetical protein
LIGHQIGSRRDCGLDLGNIHQEVVVPDIDKYRTRAETWIADTVGTAVFGAAITSSPAPTPAAASAM